MIEFRCWYCNKRYSMAEQRVGQRLTCSCDNPLRVPRRSGGYCRVKTPADRLVEAVVYGGGGALLGLGLSLLVLSKGGGGSPSDWPLIAALVLTGFLAGTLGGERGMSWVGGLIRDREKS